MIEDKEVLAYFIGLMAGDGAFLNGNGERTDRMAFCTVSEELVYWINNNIDVFELTNGILNNNDELGITAKQLVYRKTFSTKYTSLFKEMGILAKKESRILCNIPKVNMRQYLLGLMDADGCISYSIRKDRNRVTASVSYTHPSITLLNSIQKFLVDSLSIPSTVSVKRAEKCYVLKFSKLTDIIKFCEWLYSIPYVLSYKYNKWVELHTLIKEQYTSATMFPREFCHTPEYLSLVGQSKSTYIVIVEGKEFPSVKKAAEAHGITDTLARQRSASGAKGWGRRPKTEEEKLEYTKYIKNKIKTLFFEWQEVNDI